MQTIQTDFENIRLAWEWASKNHHETYLHDLLNGIYLFGFVSNRYYETIAMFQQALDNAVSDVSLLGRLLARRWGYLHWWFQIDNQDALAGIEHALTIALEQGNPFEIAFAHLMMAYGMIRMQRYTNALSHLETSKTLFEIINEPYYVCWVLHRFGYIHYDLNNVLRAQEYTEQSLTLARTMHNHLALVICLYNLGSSCIRAGNFIKGHHYCAEALEVATESGHRGQIAHSLSLLALCSFYEGDYETALKHAERSKSIIEDVNLLVLQSYNIAVLILLSCLRDDYSEAVRLKELESYHVTNKMGYQLIYWALATLSWGLGNRAEAQIYVQKGLELSAGDADAAFIKGLIPSASYVLAETDPKKALELLSWVKAYPDDTLNWVHRWFLLDQLQNQLQAEMDAEGYHTYWEKGRTLTYDAVSTYIFQEFHSSPDKATQKYLLTVREHDILQLIATGMTNPQIAEELVIGASTVKTHTLNIYRKLEVANRTEALIRAQQLGLLPTKNIHR
jgi:ATP/maltotriose-dependent transcriptional regulator MalT